MKLQIEISLESLDYDEIARILTMLNPGIEPLGDAKRLFEGGAIMPLDDINGNPVGAFARLVEEDQCRENLRDQAVAYLHYTEKMREKCQRPKSFGGWTLDQTIKKGSYKPKAEKG